MASSLITTTLADPYDRMLARSILKTDQPDKIRPWLERAASMCLGWRFAECFHVEFSVGAVFGLRNEKGQSALLKVYGPDASKEEAEAKAAFQTWLKEQSFPCPGILAGPRMDEDRLFVIEEYLDAGRRADGHLAMDRKLMARALYDLIDMGRSYPAINRIPEDTLKTVPDSPWPKPHNVLFDFEKTAEGAEWIDEVGRKFAAPLKQSRSEEVIGHIDWGAKHTRIKDDEISVIYDWDSIARKPETQVVARAALNFTVSWYVDSDNRPSLDEIKQFIQEYENYRGRSFDDREIEEMASTILYAAGYTARCEHAIRDDNITESRDQLKLLLEADIPSLLRSGSAS